MIPLGHAGVNAAPAHGRLLEADALYRDSASADCRDYVGARLAFTSQRV